MYWFNRFSSGALALLLLLLAPLCFGQTVLWQKKYRSGYPNETGTPFGESAKIANGRYVHAGSVYSQARNSSRAYLLFTNAQGDSLNTVISNAGVGVASVVGNGDGTFTWSGAIDTLSTPTRAGNLQHTLVKMNAQGQVLWQRTFNGTRGNQNYFGGQIPLLRTPDGYLAGSNTYVYVNPPSLDRLAQQAIDKFDNNGRLQWRTIVPAYAANTNALALQANGSYVAAGWALVPTPLTLSGYFSLDGRLVEFTHGGDTLRTKRLGVEGDYENLTRVRPTADKGVVLLLESQVRLPANSPREQRLVKLDSLWRVQWNTVVSANVSLYFWDVRVDALGEYVLVGERSTGAVGTTGRVARYSASGQLTWASDVGLASNPQTALRQLLHEPGDPLMAWGTAEVPNPPGPGVAPSTQRFFSAGFGNVAGPFVPDYCRYPPVPNAAYLQPQPDSLVLLQLSTAGPRYAQNVIFRWELGDGTVVERNMGGAVRHRYAPGRVPGPGTAVRLTLTNNLGCTATQTLYPWGRPTAAQQARALGARATLWPNPTAGTATLALAEAPAGGATVQVLDALGRVLQTRTLPAGAAALTLDVGGLAAGVYAVRVSAVAGSFAKRLVRE